ncbi:hypothetical protein [Nocardioides stalactiti]|uniref:hypothetical protein n=1 Tax=Nocardioides stalactiti TaxID=2755356 RepID=UPI001601D3E1|nr:hypothetical protein [Nocardioides stalactiti]
MVVHGRLSQRSYDRNGVEVVALEIDALVVGHDLTKGVSRFEKTVGHRGEGDADGSVDPGPVPVTASP